MGLKRTLKSVGRAVARNPDLALAVAGLVAPKLVRKGAKIVRDAKAAKAEGDL